MAVLVSDNTLAGYTGKLSGANQFYISRTYNLGTAQNPTSLATPQVIPVTFTSAGAGEKCKGVVIALMNPVSGPYITYSKDVTVVLQELVGGTTWTDRATCTHTPAEINPGRTDVVLGYWLVPFKFATPYAISTTAGVWRFSVSQSATAGNPWSIGYTTAGNFSYVAWGDTTATASSGNDTLIVVDKVIIDTTFTLKPILGTGVTTYGICGWICRNTDVTQAGNALLEWENPAVSAYTFTVDGHLNISNHAGFRVGTQTVPIKYAQQAKIVLKSVPTAGTEAPSSIKACTQYYHDGYQSLFFYGEIPTYMSDTLDGNANAGQKTVTTAHSTGWKSGDTVYIGRENVDSSGDTTANTLSVDASGTTITLTNNIAGQNRLSGGHIVNATPYGVWITTDANTVGRFVFHMINNMVFSGCRLTKINVRAGNNNSYCRFDSEANTSQWLFQDTFFEGAGYAPSCMYDSYYMPGTKGILWNRCIFHLTIPAPYYNKLSNTFGGVAFPTGSIGLTNSIVLHGYGAFVTQVTFPALTANVENNYFENNTNGVGFAGVGGTFKNNDIYSVAAFTAGINLFTGLYPADLSGNTVNRAGIGLTIPAGAVLVGYQMLTLTLNNLYANDIDISNAVETFIDLEIASPTGLVNIASTTNLMMVGSRLRIPSATATGDDRTYTTYGDTQRTGTGLTDTTAHTAGGYAIRFEPKSSTIPVEWEFTVPTGNIQNKTMTVAVWVKINSATYYAGTNQLPRLYVDYDNGTTTYCQASQTTDWQLLYVTIAPTTTYGQLIIKLNGFTDAVTSNAYFYADDFAVLYPAGYKLDLGNLDNWANGLPVTPPIATVLSANDVWTAVDTADYGAGTMGNRVKKLKNPSLLIDNEVIV